MALSPFALASEHDGNVLECELWIPVFGFTWNHRRYESTDKYALENFALEVLGVPVTTRKVRESEWSINIQYCRA